MPCYSKYEAWDDGFDRNMIRTQMHIDHQCAACGTQLSDASGPLPVYKQEPLDNKFVNAVSLYTPPSPQPRFTGLAEG